MAAHFPGVRMASQEFKALQAALAAQPAPEPPRDLPELRARIDRNQARLPLAEGVAAREVDAGGVPAILLEPEGVETPPDLLYFHGGGYRIGSALGWRAYGSHLARACAARVLLADYRLAPEHPFPAAVDDAAAAYAWLLESSASPGRVVLGGDSAGGGLAAAALIDIRRRGRPSPAGGVLISPWADLTNRAETFRTRAEADKLFSLRQAREASELYLQGRDPTHPLASPVFADWSGAPPLLIHVGDAEVLLDDAHRLARRAREAGVDVRLRVYDEMPHVWPLSYPAFPEAVQAVDEIAAFVTEVTGAAQLGAGQA